MRLIISIISFLLFFENGIPQVAQHFYFTSKTGNNATICVPLSVNPNIGGIPLSFGDEIGVFSPTGLCVGAIVWTQSNNAITVWGDNDMTPEIDGIQVGDTMHYRIWKASENREYFVDNVSYLLGDGIYRVDGIYVLNVLFVTEVNFNSEEIDFYLSEAYPNPIKLGSNNYKKIYFDFHSKANVFVEISVFNLIGQKIFEINNVEVLNGLNRLELSLHKEYINNDLRLCNGIYFVSFRVHNKNSTYNKLNIITKKFIIIN